MKNIDLIMLEVLDLSLKLNLNISEDKLIEVGLHSYDLTIEAQRRYLDYPASNIHVWVEQGSVNYRYKICLGLSILYNVVSGIDGFIGGIEKIVSYSNKAMSFITEESINTQTTRTVNILSYKRTTGFPGTVKSLMYAVSNGALTPDEATEKLIKLLDTENENLIIRERFIDKFYSASTNIYRYPIKQLELYPTEEFEVPIQPIKNKPVSQKRPYSPPIKPHLQGVEIWQDPESGEKKIKTYTK